MMIRYLNENLIAGLCTSPRQGIKLHLILFMLFAVMALIIGFPAGLFTFALLDSKLAYILPFTLFIFPSLFEEAVFRGVLIPNNTQQGGIPKIIFYSLMSSTLFVIWHPINALTINPGAKSFFLDPWFLFITFILGMVCSLGYIFSRSLWVPIIMHWLTVVIWVFLLGGRNLIIE